MDKSRELMEAASRSIKTVGRLTSDILSPGDECSCTDIQKTNYAIKSF